MELDYLLKDYGEQLYSMHVFRYLEMVIFVERSHITKKYG